MELFLRGLAVITGIAFWMFGGVHLAMAFLLGTFVAYLNFRWLHHIVSRFAKVASTGGKASGWRVPLQAVLRFALLLTCLYVIFTSYPSEIPGFLAGLLTPIAAAICEGVCEAYVLFRRGG